MFVDTHAHLFKEYYDNIDDVMKLSFERGACLIINSGVNGNTNKEVLESTTLYDNMYCSLGIHPEYANDYETYDISFIESNINNNKVIAIGEIGLDYHYEDINKEKQIELFKKQLSLAEKYNIPVVIHSRDAGMDTLNILKKYTVKGVIHAFSGSYEIAKEYIKLGFKLGVGGVITFKNAKIIDVIKKVGINNIVLETDSPYLSPVPVRGTKNIPGNICYVVDFLSKSLKVSSSFILTKVMSNVNEIFDI